MASMDSSELNLENLLSAVTDALLAEQSDINAIIRRYDVKRANVDSFVAVIRRMHVVMVRQEPSEKFVRRLKQDLVGRNQGMVARVRYLPARVQLAAGVALLAGSGVMLLIRRRVPLLGEGEDRAEIPLLQQ